MSFDVAYSRPVGTYNKLEIWGSKYFGKSKDLYGILDKNRNVLAWTVFDVVRYPGYSTFERAWVRPEQRGKHHTLTIINFLIVKAKEKILIDSQELTSNSSRSMLKKWFTLSPQLCHFSINFFVGDKKVDQPNVDLILKPGTTNNTYIIMEDIFKRNLPRYGAGKRILNDVVWY